jgi:hypothetical protein
MAGTRIHSPAKLRAQMLWTVDVGNPRIATRLVAPPRVAIVKILNLRAECHRPDLAVSDPFYLRAGLGKPQCNGERFA